jgi:hypothetical protein
MQESLPIMLPTQYPRKTKAVLVVRFVYPPTFDAGSCRAMTREPTNEPVYFR